MSKLKNEFWEEIENQEPFYGYNDEPETLAANDAVIDDAA